MCMVELPRVHNLGLSTSLSPTANHFRATFWWGGGASSLSDEVNSLVEDPKMLSDLKSILHISPIFGVWLIQEGYHILIV